MNISKSIRSIRSRLPKTMLRDRSMISAELKKIQREAGKAEQDQGLSQMLSSLEKKLGSSIRKRSRRMSGAPEVSFPSNLPISEKADEIIQAIKENQVLIIAGDTGSGKSTQIPKMCLAAGRGIAGMIGCTQPRRIAANSIARRIAEEIGEDVGGSVGYKIRFMDRSSRDGYIKIMTDGMLLAETQEDPKLYGYDTIIIDEAHERSLNIDFLIGIVRNLLKKRKELKVIVTSATMDTEKFSEGFFKAPVITVHGRVFPVETRYMPPDPRLEERGDITYVDSAVKTVERLIKESGGGDILVFMPTEQDILETCDILKSSDLSGTLILPLFARLSSRQQRRVFASGPGRKIVVATNVAETSLTIPGIRYVIDTGLARISRYLPRSRITSLPISPISRSSADQRMGRCGRLAEGICVRLYPEKDYETRPRFTPPEILRSNLAEVIMRMISLDLGDVRAFPFLDSPGQKSIKDGFDLLRELGATERDGRRVSLTKTGRVMARMPLDPKISRMLIEAKREDCIREVTIIASALSIQDPRVRPIDQAEAADRKHAAFKDPDSDFITLLNIWNRYFLALDDLKTQNRVRRYCRDNFLSYVRMREWRHIHSQISTILKEQKIRANKAVKNRRSPPRYDRIHRSILSGYLSNIALKKEKNLYQAARNREAMIFPGSSLFNRSPHWIVAAEMVRTSRLFARCAARIESEWLEPLGGKMCRYSYSDPHWEKNRGSVIANEQVSLYGLVIIPKRSVQYGRINPEVSHEIFIRSAIMDGQVKGSFPFLEHNRELIQQITAMEDKVRRKDILVSEERVLEFYSERLPGICDTVGLKNLLRKRGSDDFLILSEDDLIISEPDHGVLSMFPDRMSINERQFDLAYRFAPGQNDDGVTIKVPSTLASQVNTAALDWLVPGLLKEKVFTIIKGLPKRYRKQLVPVSESVNVIMTEMERTDQSLINCLGKFIYQRFKVDIPASAWPLAEIQDHLRIRISITDHKGREIKTGRDINILKEEIPSKHTKEKEAAIWKKARDKWEKKGIKFWDFGDLPDQIPLGPSLNAYPALVPEVESLSLRLFSSYEEALKSHKDGVASLFLIYLKKDLKLVKKSLVLPEEMRASARYFGGRESIDKSLYNALINRLFCLDIRTEEAFNARAASLSPGLVKEEKAFLSQAITTLKAYEEAWTTLDAIETKNRANSSIFFLIQQLRKELDRLMPRSFLELYSTERHEQIPRYLKALSIRAQRGAVDPRKDLKKASRIEPFIKTFNTMRENVSVHASFEKRNEIAEFGWMVDEFKVSLFAPELKTPLPISAKRLEKKAEEIERMV